MQRRPWLKTYEKLDKIWESVAQVAEKNLSDYVRDYAAAYADRIALVYFGTTTTYSKLNSLTDQFAQLLLDLGATKGDVLAVQMPNTPQYVVAFAAAARIGLVVTSVSPLLAAPEIIHQCNDAKAKVFLTLDVLYRANASVLAGKIPSLKSVVVSAVTDMIPGMPATDINSISNNAVMGDVKVVPFLAALNTVPNTGADSPLKTSVDFNATHYLQYTGGTTGAPKGVQLSASNIFTNNVQGDHFYGYRNGEETIASGFPLFHIGGAAILFNALRTASTFLLIADPRDLEQFCRDMALYPPTVIANVPALFQMLVNYDKFRALDFSGLRIAVSGAAPFSVEELKRLEEVVGPNKLCEVYGMTETSPVQTLNPAEAFKPGYVGIPLPGTDLRIVDSDNPRLEQPIGTPGEVVVSGPQVMQGYLARPEATAEALLEFGGKRWMRTGDIGFLDEDGYLKICDRSKDMLIVGGYKVFSVEVENKLQELPFVDMAAVVGRADEDRPGNDIVQVYIQRNAISKDSDEARRQSIIEFCRANMAPYKVPKEIFFVDALPLTSVGKIDKKVLRAKQFESSVCEVNV